MEYLKTEKIGPQLWRVLEQFGPVPQGFVTDGASVPRFFWRILPPMTGAHAEDAVIHDWDFSLDSPYIPFEIANERFRDRMIKRNIVKSWKIKLAYQTIKYFGKSSFKKCQSLEKMENAYKELR